jgi:16S rRNA (cytosine1402-N4)-methyltransferase
LAATQGGGRRNRYLAVTERHQPVMAKEIVDLLVTGTEEWIVDATVGSGGHAAALLGAMGPGGRLIGLDQDRRALTRAAAALAGFGERALLRRANFRNMAEVVSSLAPGGVDGVLMDLGVSSEQIDDPGSGFSFQTEGPLSMTMDPDRRPDAAELVNTIDRDELARVLREYGDVRNPRRVADAIVASRPLGTTNDLKLAARRAGAGRPEDLARVFQAVRIAVNDERGALDLALASLEKIVRPGGRVAILSYHSGEDRAVKRFFTPTSFEKPLPWSPAETTEKKWERLTKGVLKPSEAEVARNSRSRSARLRAVRRVGK